MTMTLRTLRKPGLVVALACVLPVAVAASAPAAAAGGLSTPGVTVVAVNPGTRVGANDLAFALTAHSALAPITDPASCRPQDRSLRCWGSLTLRVPDLGGLKISEFEVHRVVVGDTSCADEGGEDEGCGDRAIDATTTGQAVEAQVNGVAVVTDPGSSGYPAGTPVQVKVALIDNGPALYGDQAEVVVNEFVPGPVKPLIYDSGVQTVEQVQIHARAKTA